MNVATVRPPSDALIRKAARMTAARRPDGSWQVAGDHDTYTVHIRLSPTGDREYYCDCASAQSQDRWCSHALSLHLKYASVRTSATLQESR